MPVKIFICYAHEDEALLKKLKAHLAPLQHQGLIEVWHDRDISAGTEWAQEVIEQLDTAQIILLLISPDFMVSEYCYGTEMRRAIERHENGEAYVIPVILRYVAWHDAPFGKLQALPKDGKPITSWRNKDEAFFRVVEGIRRAIEHPHQVETGSSIEKPDIVSLSASPNVLSPKQPTLAMTTVASQEAPVLNKTEPSPSHLTQKIYAFLTSKASFLFKISSISLGVSTVIYAAIQAINSNLPNVDLNHILDTTTFVKYYPPVLAIPFNLIVFIAFLLMFLSPAVLAISGVMSGKTSFVLKISLIALGIGLIGLIFLISANAALPGVDSQHISATSTYIKYYPPILAILLILARDILDMLIISGSIVFVVVGITYGIRNLAKRSKTTLLAEVESHTPYMQRQTTTQPKTSPPLRRLFNRIPYALVFFGGLAVEIADLTWLIIISQIGDNGQYLVHSNPYLNKLAVLIFLFAIILDVLLIIHSMIIMARLKRRRWFIGLLLGSIGGAAVIFLPGLALMMFGLFAPRTPAAPTSARGND